MPVEADQSGHHVIEEADSKYWWLHRGVKEHAPTIDPVMIPYRFTGGNFAAKVEDRTKLKPIVFFFKRENMYVKTSTGIL